MVHPFPRRWTVLAGALVATLAALVLAPQAQAAKPRQDPATVTLAADLRRSPEIGAAVVATLAPGETVTVLSMRGSQAQVQARAGTGWVPVSKLHLGDAPGAAPASGGSGGGSGGGASFLRGITGILGGGGGADDGAKVTIGVRGLQKKDLANARPDPAAVDRMERFRSSPADGEAHASAVGLASYRVEYRQSRAAPSAPGAAGSAGSDN